MIQIISDNVLSNLWMESLSFSPLDGDSEYQRPGLTGSNFLLSLLLNAHDESADDHLSIQQEVGGEDNDV